MPTSLELSSKKVLLTEMTDFSLRISGLPKSKHFELCLEVTDENSIIWSSSCSMQANSKGDFLLPGGSMLGVNDKPCVAHCFQALRSNKRNSWFDSRNLAPLNCCFKVKTSNNEELEDEFSLYPYARDLQISKLDAPFHGRLYQPAEPTDTVVICLPGSQGVQPDSVAAVLASVGCSAVALTYFGAPGLNNALQDVPLEIIFNAQQHLINKFGFNKVGLLGSSKGAELALVAASKEQFAFVVAVSPSAYVFQGLGDFAHPSSSWTLGGAPLPYVPIKISAQGYAAFLASKLIKKPMSLLSFYERSIAKDNNIASTIDVASINAPILLLSGKQDKLWPATKMSEIMQQELYASGHEVEHYAITTAGHVTLSVLPGFPYLEVAGNGGLPLRLGGSLVANTQALARMWGHVSDFVRQHCLEKE